MLRTLENIHISVAIPTYGREDVLLDTIRYLLVQKPKADEILVIDQTLQHEPETEKRLQDLENCGDIRWIKLKSPSITHAMNVGLEQARYDIVLFLDDDIIPGQRLFSAHIDNYKDTGTWAVVGQVLQPGESPYNGEVQCRITGLRDNLDFPFNSSSCAWVNNVMAGNLSVRKDRALNVGGFDENFVGTAYRFETEFGRRLCKAGGKILFEPGASIRHLKAEHGGTRSSGRHLTSPSPKHGVGDYYFALRQGLNIETLAYMCWRPFREVRTKFHLLHPWWIPVKLIGEFRALFLAVYLSLCGPRYLHATKKST